MAGFTLNFTYGDIRAILKKIYTKGARRTLLGSQSGIHELEQAIKDYKDDDQVTTEKFLQCVTITNAIVQKSLINPKNIAAKKAGTYKKKAHNRCSEALLDFFSEQFGAHYTQNSHEALREAILHDDVDYVQWCTDIQSPLNQYQNYSDSEHHKEPKSGGDASISCFLYDINKDTESNLESQNKEAIEHLIMHPNIHMYNALYHLPTRFFKKLLITPTLDEIIKNTLAQGNPSMSNMLDWLLMTTSLDAQGKKHPPGVRDTFSSNTLMQALLTNNNDVLRWFEGTSLSSSSRRALSQMHLDENDISRLINECEPEMLNKFITLKEKISLGRLNNLLITKKPLTEGFLNLFLSAMKRQNIDILVVTLKLVKERDQVEICSTLRASSIPKTIQYSLYLANAAQPSLLEGQYGADIAKLFHDEKIKIDGLMVEEALKPENSTFFFWIINYTEKWMEECNEWRLTKDNLLQHNFIRKKTYNSSAKLSINFFVKKILAQIARSNDPELLNKLANSVNFKSIGIENLLQYLMTNHRTPMDALDRKNTLTKIARLFPDMVSTWITTHDKQGTSPDKFIQLNADALFTLLEDFPAHEEIILNTQLIHAAFSQFNLSEMQQMALRYPQHLNDFIAYHHYHTFMHIAEHKPQEQLDWLTKNTHHEMLTDMIQKRGHGLYLLALSNKNLNLLEWINKIDPAIIVNAIKEGNHPNIQNNFSDKAFHFVKWFFKNTKEHFGDILYANKKSTKRFFMLAVQNNDLTMLKVIAEHAPDLLSSCIRQNGFDPFLTATNRDWDQRELILWLLEDPDCFAYAESLAFRNDTNMDPYIIPQIHQLRERMIAHESELPDAAFNVSNEREAKHAFYMLRALIRRNGNIDDINFLLTIPSVRALAHQAIGREPHENELLRLAIIQNNDDACRLLLEIDEVRILAEANDFYQNDLVTTVNLRELAENRESAMVALNAGEVHALDKAFKYYHGPITAKGVPFLIDELRNKIIETYEKNPAKIITTSGETLELPATHVNFELLNLHQEDRQKALEAYYTHQIHGAYRFLCRPNLWMHPEAIFVERNANREGWASARCDNLIAMLYLAAIDENIPCIRDFTLKTKWIHFLHELALINRGHNWDKSKNGVEYDDKEADRPSCGPGMERRLFQSVPGNPLLTIFTKDMLLQIIGSFAFQYFTEKLKNENAAEIVKVLNENIIELDSTHIKTLTIFNIPQKKYEDLKNQIMKSFGDDFNSRLQTLFDKQFELETSSEDVLKHYHVFTLDGLSHFYDHLIKLYPEPEPAPEPSKPSETGLFAHKDNTPDSEKSTPNPTPRKIE